MREKTILITGAGSGIGAAVARLFAERRWIVGLYDLNPDSVAEIASELGSNCCHGVMDVTDRDSVRAGIDHFAKRTNGRLDVLLNNAGIFEDRAFIEADPAFLDKMVDVNAKGVVNCAYEAFAMLKGTSGSQMINLGSASSIYGVPMEAVYSSTKFFVRGLSEALRVEWQPFGIGVKLVMPSYVRTPLIADQDISWADKENDKLLDAEDVAETVWKAAHRDRLYWIIPFEARLMMSLVRAVPLQWVSKIAAKLLATGQRKSA